MWKCRFGRRFPGCGHWSAGCIPGFWLDGADDCIFIGSYIWGSFEPGRFHRLTGWWSIPGQDLLPYIVAQVLGAIAAAGVLYLVATGNGSSIGDFAANGYGDHSPGKYNMTAAFITEFVMTFIFLLIILGATDDRAPKGFAGIAIGLALTLIHLISIPVTNTSVNPRRSISQAIFVGDWAIGQLWLFIAAPIAGAVVAGIVYGIIGKREGIDDVISDE